MKFTKTIFSDSAIFISKKTVENQWWAKLFEGKMILFISAMPRSPRRIAEQAAVHESAHVPSHDCSDSVHAPLQTHMLII